MDHLGVDELTRDLILAQDGDRLAFRRVVFHVDPHIRRFSTWLIGPSAEPDDIVQETLFRVYKGINSYRGQSHAMSWILSIARRVCLDSLRQDQKHQKALEAVQANLQEETADQDIESIHLFELIQMLPHELREVFVLVKMLGFKYSEVADIVDCPIGTVQSRVARARIELTNMLVANATISESA